VSIYVASRPSQSADSPFNYEKISISEEKDKEKEEKEELEEELREKKSRN
jgi:hypothetical protein